MPSAAQVPARSESQVPEPCPCRVPALRLISPVRLPWKNEHRARYLARAVHRRDVCQQPRQGRSRYRRKGAFVDPLRHPDERPDCSSAAAFPAVNTESGRVPARPESGRGRGCKSRATRKIVWGIDADRAEHLLPQLLPRREIASDDFEEKLLTL